MFGTIRRHQNWLWIIIITITILSFVIFFSPNVNLSGAGNRPGKVDCGSIDGKPISVEEFLEGEREARLNQFFQSGGQWPGADAASAERLRNAAVSRIFLMKKVQEYDIKVSDDAVARLTRERLGRELADNIDRFAAEYLTKQGVTLQDLENYLRHEASIQQLVSVAAASARLLNPKEAEKLYKSENETMKVEVATFWGSNYLDKVTVTNEALGQFYTNRMANYRIPERIQIDYVAFPVTNFLAEADKLLVQRTNLTAAIDQEYAQKGADAFKNDKGEKLSEADAKAKLKEEVRRNFALSEAHRKANAFATDLYNTNATNVATFEKLATDSSLEVKVTPPFDRTKGLEDTDFPPSFKAQAFDLTDQAPVSVRPLIASNAVYVIALKQRLPSIMQNFDQVKDKVTADYKLDRAMQLARQEGQTFAGTVTNALQQGKSFEDLAKSANAKIVSIPEFTASTTSLTNIDERINFRTLHNVASDLKKGQASQFIPTADGGMVIYMRDRIPVSDDQVKEHLPEFLSRLRLYRQSEAFNQWFRKEAEEAHLTFPKKENEKQGTLPQAKS
jgi:peptidyl-prolyl cis-trans isomerase D